MYIMSGLLVVWMLFITTNLVGQQVVTYKTAPEGVKKVYRKGLEASRGYDFDKALSMFNKAIRMEPGFIDAHIQIASLYYENKDFREAEKRFEKVIELDSTYKPKVFYSAGVAEWNQEKYDEAATHLRSYLDLETDNEVLLKRASRLYDNALFLSRALRDPVPFKPEKLSSAINTGMAEYLPSITADGQEFYFTRVVDGQEDFYFSTKKNGEWQESRPLTDINSLQNEGAQTITADGKLMVFTACDRMDGYGSCDLYYSYKVKGRWSLPQNIGSPVNTKAWESQPCLSANGDALYFSSKRPGGLGGRDIWVAYRQVEGGWGVPQNLGLPINTEQDEEAPFMHPDSKTLYFMSDGHPGMGGTDLYLSRRQPDGTFGIPQNLGYPINTKAHEGALFISLDGGTAYFATDRDRVGDTLIEQTRSRNTDIYQFELHEKARPLPVTYVQAVVRDAHTGEPLSASVSFYDIRESRTHVEASTDSEGLFLFCLPAQSDYGLHVQKPGYLFYSDHFGLSGGNVSLKEPIRLEIDLQPVLSETKMESKPIRLNNVFFEVGSAVLLPESINELNQLKNLLEDTPEIRIRINGHTDNVGTAADNQQLSRDRAKAVYSFLIESGISANRLQYAGFGEEHPVADNSTEEGRQKNRRTEFEVLR